MNQSAMLARFVRETDIDVFLLAGRYTLLDQAALDELLPLRRARHRCPRRRGHEQRRPGRSAAGRRVRLRAGAAEVLERARRLGEACARHGVPLRAAAMQFPLPTRPSPA